MAIVPLLKGIATFVPGVGRLWHRRRGSARYCYSIWLRHLVMAEKSGVSTDPGVVAELGPGGSLGVGIAALLTGANRYNALDVRPYATDEQNLIVFDELVELLARRESVPDGAEFPMARPLLDSYEFPSNILTEPRLEQSMDRDRVASIRTSLSGLGGAGLPDSYVAHISPWYDSDVIQASSLDMVFSQAVLEHVGDLSSAYETLGRWLRPGGIMSHTIDFRSHGYASKWDGHWAYSDFVWKLVEGRRPFLINRQPYSVHIELMDRFEFEVVEDVKDKSAPSLSRRRLASRFRHLSDDDLTTSGAFVQAICRKK